MFSNLHNDSSIRRRLTYASPEDPKSKQFMIRLIESLTGQRRLARVYENILAQTPHDEPEKIWPAALSGLKIATDYAPEQLQKAPKDGPLILIANHPYGVLDGIILCHLAAQVRADFKILIHRSLCFEQRVSQHMLPVDFAETEEAVHMNIETKRQALNTLRAGNAIVIFPAGGISTTANGPFGPAVDLEWKLFVTKLIQMTKATVLPIYFHGQNSRIFQFASQFSETLRLALIMHEVNRKEGETIHVEIGDPIFYEQLADIRKRKDLLNYLRNAIYGLAPTKIVHHPVPRLPSERRAARQQRQHKQA